MRILIWFITFYKQLHLDQSTVFGDLFNLLMFHIGPKCLQWGNDNKWVLVTSLTWLILLNGWLGIIEVCPMETLLPEDKDGQTPSCYWLLQRFICFSSSAHLHTPQCCLLCNDYLLCPDDTSLWMGFIFGLTCLSSQIFNALGSRMFHGSVLGSRDHSSSFKKRFNIENFVLMQSELWAQCWVYRRDSQNCTAELPWNFSCYLVRKAGNQDAVMEQWNSKAYPNSLIKLETGCWNFTAEKSDTSPSQPYLPAARERTAGQLLLPPFHLPDLMW